MTISYENNGKRKINCLSLYDIRFVFKKNHIKKGLALVLRIETEKAQLVLSPLRDYQNGKETTVVAMNVLKQTLFLIIIILGASFAVSAQEGKKPPRKKDPPVVVVKPKDSGKPKEGEKPQDDDRKKKPQGEGLDALKIGKYYF